jgi:hypothetical protein
MMKGIRQPKYRGWLMGLTILSLVLADPLAQAQTTPPFPDTVGRLLALHRARW